MVLGGANPVLNFGPEVPELGLLWIVFSRRPEKLLSGNWKREVEFKGHNLHNGFGGFDGFLALGAIVTVLTVSAVMAVSVMTATPLKLTEKGQKKAPLFRHPDLSRRQASTLRS